MKRRNLLGAGLVLSLAGMAGPRAVRGQGALQQMDSLEQSIRLRGALSGELWLWIQGDVFGRQPEETLRPLCGFCSVLRMRYRRQGENSFVFEQRESAHFYDVARDRILERFENPYTGRSNIPVGYVSPQFRFRIDSDGVYGGPELDQHQGLSPRGLESDGLDIWTTEVRANEYPTGLRHKEFPEAYASEIRRSKDIATYRARLSDVLDPSIRVVRSQVSFVADLPWLQWMLMGKVPGHVFWYGQGAKCENTTELPKSLTSRVNTIHPGFLDDPWGLDGEPYGTLYQMRKLRKEGKI